MIVSEKERERRILVEECYRELAEIHARINVLMKKVKQELNALKKENT